MTFCIFPFSFQEGNTFLKTVSSYGSELYSGIYYTLKTLLVILLLLSFFFPFALCWVTFAIKMVDHVGNTGEFRSAISEVRGRSSETGIEHWKIKYERNVPFVSSCFIYELFSQVLPENVSWFCFSLFPLTLQIKGKHKPTGSFPSPASPYGPHIKRKPLLYRISISSMILSNQMF